MLFVQIALDIDIGNFLAGGTTILGKNKDEPVFDLANRRESHSND